MSADYIPWWKRIVIYQIYPRSFQDSSGSGTGDLNGITQRLDYLKELGVDTIWISPFFPSPMIDFGYDVTDHRDVDPTFGTRSDFDALVARAKALNLKIMMDLVLNHTSDQHRLFRSSREDPEGPHGDYYVWADAKEDGTPPNNWLSIFGGPAWTWDSTRQQYYLHNFLTEQPDLNYHHPGVRERALAIAKYWLDRGVSGFRFDAVNFYFHDPELRSNPPSKLKNTKVVAPDNPYGRQEHIYDKNRPEVSTFLKAMGTLLSRYPNSVGLGELGAEPHRASELIKEYLAPGHLDLCYDFGLLGHEFSAAHFRKIIEDDLSSENSIWRCLAFSNHDVIRTATRFSPSDGSQTEIAALAMALLLSMRGTPCIYQGEELGLTEAEIPFELIVDPYGKKFYPKFKGRDGCRTPMPWTSDAKNCSFSPAESETWLPIPEAHQNLAVNLQQGTDGSLLRLTRQLIDFRRRGGFGSDTLTLLPGSDPLLAFARGEHEDGAIFIFNISAQRQVMPFEPSRYVFEETLSSSELILGEESIELPPWGWFIGAYSSTQSS